MKTDRLYYTDCYLEKFHAHVLEISDQGRRVYLDKSAFYPTSGGQPNDLGVLSGIPILDIVDENDRVAHVLDSCLEATEVDGAIDFERRYDHMQQHTGQHLLSAVAVELFGAQTVSFHMGPQVSTIELAAKELTPEQLDAAELKANKFVWQSRPVNIYFEDSDAAHGLRKPTQRPGVLRIVEIEGIDRSACGGTHVRSTAELGPIQIRSSEKVRGGNARIEFVCGLRALKRAKQDFRVAKELAKQAATGIDNLPDHLASVRERLGQTEKASERLRAEIARRDGLALYISSQPDGDGIRRTLLRVQAIDAAVREQAREYASQDKAVLLAIGSEPAGLLLACSGDSGINAGAILKEVVVAEGGRGGGSATLAQGNLPNPQTAYLVARAAGFVSLSADSQ